MMPWNRFLTKGISKVDIIRYIRTGNRMHYFIFDEIDLKNCVYGLLHDDLYELKDMRLPELVERVIEQNDEAILAKDYLNPFEGENKFELAKEIYDDFNRESKNK